MKRFRLLALVVLFLSLLISFGSGTAPSRAANCRTFQETGFTVCDRFLQYWNENGGLAQQGYPITDTFVEQNAPPPAGDGKTHTVQYFQRARFELHPENQAPYDVLLGLLGAEEFHAKYEPFKTESPSSNSDCRYFADTGFNVCGRFLEYWLANGGLAQQGYPISFPSTEKNLPPPFGDGKDHQVQYFERARFEGHPENSKPYDVLLGLIGTEQYYVHHRPTTTPIGGITNAPLPSPTPSSSQTPTPTQPPGTIPPKTVPMPSPQPLPIYNIPTSGCLSALETAGTGVQICLDKPNPSQPTNVTVYARLILNGKVQPNANLHSVWHFSNKNSTCDSVAGPDGVAMCTLPVSDEPHDFTVGINVQMGNQVNQTSFTTQ